MPACCSQSCDLTSRLATACLLRCPPSSGQWNSACRPAESGPVRARPALRQPCRKMRCRAAAAETDWPAGRPRQQGESAPLFCAVKIAKSVFKTPVAAQTAGTHHATATRTARTPSGAMTRTAGTRVGDGRRRHLPHFGSACRDSDRRHSSRLGRLDYVFMNSAGRKLECR